MDNIEPEDPEYQPRAGSYPREDEQLQPGTEREGFGASGIHAWDEPASTQPLPARLRNPDPSFGWWSGQAATD
jgi:hypothetical protein